ncbi:dr1-associated corepressor [Agrilus planipennis]|uniref:Dr1-associated corepressor n=1 Tax=Agrilus planipennis TaxID=224129 RepID=A0A1W4XT97_AGRPL|nr:dr1-associated corepressor [Agrilus planipennis]
MPSKKKKYNARFPAGRIKKIMQTDEEVGKVAQAVPVIISRTLELFVESLLTKSMQITQTRNAKTLTPSHMKQCILSENRFDFLKDLVKNIPDPSTQEDNENNALEASELLSRQTSEEEGMSAKNDKRNNGENKDNCANINLEQSTSSSTSHTSVIQYGPKVSQMEQPRFNFTIENLVNKTNLESTVHIDLRPTGSQLPIPQLVSSSNSASNEVEPTISKSTISENIPPLAPLAHNIYRNNSEENTLYIDEDYDN